LSNNQSNVFVVKASKENLNESMRRLLLNFSIPIHKKKIGIKLNLCDYRTRESGATSDPLVVEALVNALKEQKAGTIYFIENDASGMNADIAFRFLGFKKLAEKHNCVLVNLANKKWTQKEIEGTYFKKIHIPDLFSELDVLINHPKMKTHGLTKVTLGLKNLAFGCMKEKFKVKHHKRIDETIVDYVRVIRSNLTIVDGFIALEKWGPTHGYPKQLGLIVGGTDMIAVDSFCARLMGFNPQQISHIKKAYDAKIGEMKYNLEGDITENEMNNYSFEFDRFKHMINAYATKYGIL